MGGWVDWVGLLDLIECMETYDERLKTESGWVGGCFPRQVTEKVV